MISICGCEEKSQLVPHLVKERDPNIVQNICPEHLANRLRS